jgi:hypothetical protein
MGMDLLQQILGGAQQRQQYQDFTNRYDQGQPWEGISDREALDRYEQIAPRLPAELRQQSFEEALARLSPEQRLQLGRYLQQQAEQQGLRGFQDLNKDGVDDRLQDSGYLAEATSKMEQQQPGVLGDLLGAVLGGGGGSGMAGGRSTGARPESQGMGALLESPIAKAALAGVAAMALKKMMSGR